MAKDLHIRRYRPGEEQEIWTLYFNTTHQVVARDYTAEQVARWAPEKADLKVWAKQLAETQPLVAVIEHQIVGFAELESNGHIDTFYCHHRWQRRGVGTALLEAMEAEAIREDIEVLFAEVSTTAVAFFLEKGFVITEEHAKLVCGTPAKQYMMRKHLRI